jgi:hypothetical protein
VSRHGRKLAAACATVAELSGRIAPRRTSRFYGPAGCCQFCDGPLDAEFADNGVGMEQLGPAECLRCGSWQDFERHWSKGEGLAFHRRSSTAERRRKRWRRARRAYWEKWGGYDRHKFDEYRAFLSGRRCVPSLPGTEIYVA